LIDAVARFEREARALAALNHPNISAIYGVEDNGALPALMLELVEGDTLADRIARGALGIDQALDCARQFADALDVACEVGIVHRDLKPGNIKITDEGRLKVFDFGLAKAIAMAAGESSDVDSANSPAITVHGTARDVILGTAAYMSPDQARGKGIDKRTDIWAFGCGLFEMRTGKRAFNGETTSDVIAAIIERAPALSLLPPSTPAHLRRVIPRCLEKDPKRRIRDIAEARVDLDDAGAAQPAAPASVRRPAALAAALIAVALIGAAVWYQLGARGSGAPDDEPLEFTFSMPMSPNVNESWPVASPDGRRIAFIGPGPGGEVMLWVRSLSSSAPVALPGTEGAAGLVFWPPDGPVLVFAPADA